MCGGRGGVQDRGTKRMNWGGGGRGLHAMNHSSVFYHPHSVWLESVIRLECFAAARVGAGLKEAERGVHHSVRPRHATPLPHGHGGGGHRCTPQMCNSAPHQSRSEYEG